jgi:hypothetical protein
MAVLVDAVEKAGAIVAPTLSDTVVHSCSSAMSAARQLKSSPHGLLKAWRAEAGSLLDAVEVLLRHALTETSLNLTEHCSLTTHAPQAGYQHNPVESFEPARLLDMLEQLRDCELRLEALYALFDSVPWSCSEVGHECYDTKARPNDTGTCTATGTGTGTRTGTSAGTGASAGAGAGAGALSTSFVANQRGGPSSTRIPPLQLPGCGLSEMWAARLGGCAGWIEEFLQRCRRLQEDAVGMMRMPTTAEERAYIKREHNHSTHGIPAAALSNLHSTEGRQGFEKHLHHLLQLPDSALLHTMGQLQRAVHQMLKERKRLTKQHGHAAVAREKRLFQRLANTQLLLLELRHQATCSSLSAILVVPASGRLQACSCSGLSLV